MQHRSPHLLQKHALVKNRAGGGSPSGCPDLEDTMVLPSACSREWKRCIGHVPCAGILSSVPTKALHTAEGFPKPVCEGLCPLWALWGALDKTSVSFLPAQDHIHTFSIVLYLIHQVAFDNASVAADNWRNTQCLIQVGVLIWPVCIWPTIQLVETCLVVFILVVLS